MTPKNKSYDTASLKKLDRSEVEITGSIGAEIWEKYRAQALKNVNESITIDGFRKGMIPENILIAKVGDMAILEEMAELAISPAYVDLIIENKLDAIGRPNIQITKLAKNNPIEFKIVTAVVPEVVLPEYKKIASEKVKKHNFDDVKLTPEEIENTINNIKRQATPNLTYSSHGAEEAGNNSSTSHIESRNDNKDQSNASKDANLPELTDEFVKKLGDFDSVSDFRTKLEKMLIEQKHEQAAEKLRIQIADAILDGTKVDLPEILVQSETSRIEAQFQSDLGHMGVKLEDYLKHAKKSIEDIRKEWRPSAEKKAKLQLILNAISTKENLKPSPEDIKHEADHILEHYKDADRERAEVYAETVLTNEKVFQFLEKQ